MLVDILFIISAGVLLWKGSEWLVESAVRIAHSAGISQLVIGLTVVAFGTSAPEFAVTIGAAVQGQTNISVSNVVGSNIFNLGFILGGVAIIQAIQSSKKLIWRDGAILIVATIFTLAFLWDFHLSRLEGIFLFAGLIAYNIFLVIDRRESDEEIKPSKFRFSDVVVLGLSIGLVILGGYLLRDGAVGIARTIGIKEWVIGVTVIAAGTSAPEFATSLVACLKGHYGISAGNLVGSCIFNILGVLGLAGMLQPLDVSHDARNSLWMLLALVVISIAMLRSRGRLSKREGIFLVIVSLVIWVYQFMQ